MAAYENKRVDPMKYNLRNIVLVSMILALIQLSWGTTPTLITYQGVLKDSNGDIVADGSYSVIFRLYDVDTGGTDIGWSETHSVTTTDGIFSVVLGDALAGGQSFFGGGIAPFDVPYWLEIEIGGTVMAPRTRLTSVPYANAARSVAGSWNELGSRSRLGINTGSFADTTKAVVITQEGRVGIGTTMPAGKLHIATPHGDGIQMTDSLSGLARASLINFENSGGSLYLNDATGATQARIRGYEMSGVQAYFNAGNVGIGTDSPERSLHVYRDSSAYIKVSGDGGTYNYSGLTLEAVSDNRAWSLVHRSMAGVQNNFAIMNWDGSSFHYPFSITQGGNVGIGTGTPGRKLDILAGPYDGIQITDSSSSNTRATLLNFEDYGGTLSLFDVDGNVQARIRGYASPGGVQASFTAGNVGIGTFTPTATLEVVGSVKADTVLADTLLLSTPATRYYTMPHTAFVPFRDDVDFYRIDQYLYLSSGTNGDFYAPVQLPDGAVMKNLMVSYSADTSTVSAWMYVLMLTNGSLGTLASVQGTGSGVQTMNDALNQTVNNAAYAYYVKVRLPNPYGSCRLYAARIEYEITSPLP
ncbi:hypothetical protein ACFL6Q_02460 [Candidatus Neomarinimicrobiota bacterium]